MKKIFILTILILTLYGITAHADTTTYESGIFEYVIQENGIRITSCTDYNSETIEIPSEIDGLPVVSVGGFTGNSRKVKNVIVPEGVTEIVEMAFYYCDTLEKITLPSTLTSIGRSAFYNCDSLTELHIPQNVCSLGEEGSFRNCFSLPAITVDEENKWFSSLEGVLYNKDKTTLILYPAGKRNESFYVPDSVIRINNSAFYNCDYLRELFFSDSVVEIGEGAVFYCDNISSIHIPKNVKLIEQVPFGVCDSLEEITVSEENKYFSVENGILFNHDKTTVVFCIPNMTGSITLPSSVLEIADSAFRYSDVSEIIISEGTKTIGEMAFYNSGLQTIHIPSSLLRIDEKAFDACYSFSQIYYGGTEKQWDNLIMNKGDIMNLSLQWNDSEVNANIKIPKIYCYPNNTEILLNYMVLFCQYNKSNQLISCDIETSNSNNCFKFDSDVVTAKVLVWDNPTNIKPLLEVPEIYRSDYSK